MRGKVEAGRGISWGADRGIGEGPHASPGAWVAAQGTEFAAAAGPSALAPLLRVSADPFLPVPGCGDTGRAAVWPLSETGGIAYGPDAERE